jgi:hypothetical protein
MDRQDGLVRIYPFNGLELRISCQPSEVWNQVENRVAWGLPLFFPSTRRSPTNLVNPNGINNANNGNSNNIFFTMITTPTRFTSRMARTRTRAHKNCKNKNNNNNNNNNHSFLGGFVPSPVKSWVFTSFIYSIYYFGRITDDDDTYHHQLTRVFKAARLFFFVVSFDMVNLGGVSLGCTFLETEDAAKLYQQVVERYESGTSVYCGRLEKNCSKRYIFPDQNL